MFHSVSAFLFTSTTLFVANIALGECSKEVSVTTSPTATFDTELNKMKNEYSNQAKKTWQILKESLSPVVQERSDGITIILLLSNKTGSTTIDKFALHLQDILHKILRTPIMRKGVLSVENFAGVNSSIRLYHRVRKYLIPQRVLTVAHVDHLKPSTIYVLLKKLNSSIDRVTNTVLLTPIVLKTHVLQAMTGKEDICVFMGKEYLIEVPQNLLISLAPHVKVAPITIIPEKSKDKMHAHDIFFKYRRRHGEQLLHYWAISEEEREGPTQIINNIQEMSDLSQNISVFCGFSYYVNSFKREIYEKMEATSKSLHQPLKNFQMDKKLNLSRNSQNQEGEVPSKFSQISDQEARSRSISSKELIDNLKNHDMYGENIYENRRNHNLIQEKLAKTAASEQCQEQFTSSQPCMIHRKSKSAERSRYSVDTTSAMTMLSKPHARPLNILEKSTLNYKNMYAETLRSEISYHMSNCADYDQTHMHCKTTLQQHNSPENIELPELIFRNNLYSSLTSDHNIQRSRKFYQDHFHQFKAQDRNPENDGKRRKYYYILPEPTENNERGSQKRVKRNLNLEYLPNNKKGYFFTVSARGNKRNVNNLNKISNHNKQEMLANSEVIDTLINKVRNRNAPVIHERNAFFEDGTQILLAGSVLPHELIKVEGSEVGQRNLENSRAYALNSIANNVVNRISRSKQGACVNKEKGGKSACIGDDDSTTTTTYIVSTTEEDSFQKTRSINKSALKSQEKIAGENSITGTNVQSPKQKFVRHWKLPEHEIQIKNRANNSSPQIERIEKPLWLSSYENKRKRIFFVEGLQNSILLSGDKQQQPHVFHVRRRNKRSNMHGIGQENVTKSDMFLKQLLPNKEGLIELETDTPKVLSNDELLNTRKHGRFLMNKNGEHNLEKPTHFIRDWKIPVDLTKTNDEQKKLDINKIENSFWKDRYKNKKRKRFSPEEISQIIAKNPPEIRKLFKKISGEMNYNEIYTEKNSAQVTGFRHIDLKNQQKNGILTKGFPVLPDQNTRNDIVYVNTESENNEKPSFYSKRMDKSSKGNNVFRRTLHLDDNDIIFNNTSLESDQSLEKSIHKKRKESNAYLNRYQSKKRSTSIKHRKPILLGESLILNALIQVKPFSELHRNNLTKQDKNFKSKVDDKVLKSLPTLPRDSHYLGETEEENSFYFDVPYDIEDLNETLYEDNKDLNGYNTLPEEQIRHIKRFWSPWHKNVAILKKKWHKTMVNQNPMQMLGTYNNVNKQRSNLGDTINKLSENKPSIGDMNIIVSERGAFFEDGEPILLAGSVIPRELIEINRCQGCQLKMAYQDIGVFNPLETNNYIKQSNSKTIHQQPTGNMELKKSSNAVELNNRKVLSSNLETEYNISQGFVGKNSPQYERQVSILNNKISHANKVDQMSNTEKSNWKISWEQRVRNNFLNRNNMEHSKRVNSNVAKSLLDQHSHREVQNSKESKIIEPFSIIEEQTRKLAHPSNSRSTEFISQVSQRQVSEAHKLTTSFLQSTAVNFRRYSERKGLARLTSSFYPFKSKNRKTIKEVSDSEMFSLRTNPNRLSPNTLMDRSHKQNSPFPEQIFLQKIVTAKSINGRKLDAHLKSGPRKFTVVTMDETTFSDLDTTATESNFQTSREQSEELKTVISTDYDVPDEYFGQRSSTEPSEKFTDNCEESCPNTDDMKQNNRQDMTTESGTTKINLKTNEVVIIIKKIKTKDLNQTTKQNTTTCNPTLKSDLKDITLSASSSYANEVETTTSSTTTDSTTTDSTTTSTTASSTTTCLTITKGPEVTTNNGNIIIVVMPDTRNNHNKSPPR